MEPSSEPATADRKREQLRAAIDSLHAPGFAWALACCGRNTHEAQDVLQNAYEKIISAQARFDGRSSFKTWLFGVIRYTAAERRRWWRVRDLPAEAGWGAQPASSRRPDRLLERSEAAAALAEALPTISPRQQQVLHLVFQQDLSISEAAEVMGVSVGTARVQYERGKKALLDALHKRGVMSP